jgi:TRAP-type uncharacterized transport system fused permease subunit
MILIMPFLFVYTPLLLNSTPLDITVTVVACVVGVVAWAKFLEGFGIGRTVPMERLIWLIATACLLMPSGEFVAFVFGIEADLRYQAYAVGVILTVSMFLYQMAGRRAVV